MENVLSPVDRGESIFYRTQCTMSRKSARVLRTFCHGRAPGDVPFAGTAGFQPAQTKGGRGRPLPRSRGGWGGGLHWGAGPSSGVSAKRFGGAREVSSVRREFAGVAERFQRSAERFRDAPKGFGGPPRGFGRRRKSLASRRKVSATRRKVSAGPENARIAVRHAC
jgi:hypothetical protein